MFKYILISFMRFNSIFFSVQKSMNSLSSHKSYLFVLRIVNHYTFKSKPNMLSFMIAWFNSNFDMPCL